jgi:DNA repair protein RecN (Recombination protein N)
MLHELAVANLGVIDELRLLLGPGMTALTGETGAGKTMLVEAIELLVGGRADSVLVRPGASEASVEGRFVIGDDEVVLARVVPASGRSRAYVDGRLAPISALAEWGARLVDLHGQHAHQSLLATPAQRAALDRFGAVGLDRLREARGALAAVDAELAALGGDARARAREIDLLRFQLGEIEDAAIDDLDEEAVLELEEDRLADAQAHREAAAAAVEALTGDAAAGDAVAAALGALTGRSPFADSEARLRSLVAELSDVAADVRAVGEAIDDDPARLEVVRERRQRLRELRRKYGDTLADVVSFSTATRARLDELERHDERAAQLDAHRATVVGELATAAATVADARRAAAPALASAVERHLRDLAMPRATLAIDVEGDDPGDEVVFRLAANPGGPPLPLAKVASGGELARAMLALRLVTAGGDGPQTLVFDEVDAGIGGAAALAVGRALAAVAADRQVLVVTHLPQVAAFADTQVAVTKHVGHETTAARAEVLAPNARVVELSRMLSGSPESTTAHSHAAELLASAAQERGR